MSNNLDNEIKKGKSRKEVVKNIIIIFLFIMLVLTFFSNTIMNYSLPEVSVTRMSRESVSKNYQLELIAQANTTYDVTAENSREIKRVAVKKGQEVKKDQVIFYLSELKDSEEAKAIEKEIDTAKNEYEKAIMKAANDYFDLNQAIKQARDSLNSAINARNNYSPTPQKPDNSAEISELRQKISSLQQDLEYISSGQYDKLDNNRYEGIADVYKVFNTCKSEYDSASEEVNKIQKEIETAGENAEKIEELKKKLEELKSNQSSKEAAFRKAETDLQSVSKIINASVNSEITSSQNLLNILESQSGGAVDTGLSYEELDAAVKTAQYALDTATHNLEVQMETDRISDAHTALDLDMQKKNIADLEEKLEKLLSGTDNMEIRSPVDGVVETINFYSGQKYAENDTLMVLNISDEGFTADATVNALQSKPLKKGAEAKVISSTGSSDIKVIIKSITKDQNNNDSFKVTFKIEGKDIVSGDNIKIELGDAPAQYDNVIPKTAVKSDSSGKFVYVVKSKSTPLGNRYLVDKVNVSIVAQDDTKCAVVGDFGDSADYIITAASKPFSSGDQIKMAEE